MKNDLVIRGTGFEIHMTLRSLYSAEVASKLWSANSANDHVSSLDDAVTYQCDDQDEYEAITAALVARKLNNE